LVSALLVTVMAASVATGQLPPGYVDPAPVLDAAAKAIGTANLRCVTISGTAYAGAVGQQRESARNVDWPRVDALANYTRTMDWEHATMREELEADLLDTDRPRPTTPTSDQLSFFNAVRKLGLDPSQVVPVHGRPERWTDVRR
jgi:hypothetical protein